MKGQQRELGSSLPIVGGGDTMTKYEKNRFGYFYFKSSS